MVQPSNLPPSFPTNLFLRIENWFASRLKGYSPTAKVIITLSSVVAAVAIPIIGGILTFWLTTRFWQKRVVKQTGEESEKALEVNDLVIAKLTGKPKKTSAVEQLEDLQSAHRPLDEVNLSLLGDKLVEELIQSLEVKDYVAFEHKWCASQEAILRLASTYPAAHRFIRKIRERWELTELIFSISSFHHKLSSDFIESMSTAWQLEPEFWSARLKNRSLEDYAKEAKDSFSELTSALETSSDPENQMYLLYRAKMKLFFWHDLRLTAQANIPALQIGLIKSLNRPNIFADFATTLLQYEYVGSLFGFIRHEEAMKSFYQSLGNALALPLQNSPQLIKPILSEIKNLMPNDKGTLLSGLRSCINEAAFSARCKELGEKYASALQGAPDLNSVHVLFQKIKSDYEDISALDPKFAKPFLDSMNTVVSTLSTRLGTSYADQLQKVSDITSYKAILAQIKEDFDVLWEFNLNDKFMSSIRDLIVSVPASFGKKYAEELRQAVDMTTYDQILQRLYADFLDIKKIDYNRSYDFLDPISAQINSNIAQSEKYVQFCVQDLVARIAQKSPENGLDTFHTRLLRLSHISLGEIKTGDFAGKRTFTEQLANLDPATLRSLKTYGAKHASAIFSKPLSDLLFFFAARESALGTTVDPIISEMSNSLPTDVSERLTENYCLIAYELEKQTGLKASPRALLHQLLPLLPPEKKLTPEQLSRVAAFVMASFQNKALLDPLCKIQHKSQADNFLIQLSEIDLSHVQTAEKWAQQALLEALFKAKDPVPMSVIESAILSRDFQFLSTEDLQCLGKLYALSNSPFRQIFDTPELKTVAEAVKTVIQLKSDCMKGLSSLPSFRPGDVLLSDSTLYSLLMGKALLPPSCPTLRALYLSMQHEHGLMPLLSTLMRGKTHAAIIGSEENHLFVSEIGILKGQISHPVDLDSTLTSVAYRPNFNALLTDQGSAALQSVFRGDDGLKFLDDLFAAELTAVIKAEDQSIKVTNERMVQSYVLERASRLPYPLEKIVSKVALGIIFGRVTKAISYVFSIPTLEEYNLRQSMICSEFIAHVIRETTKRVNKALNKKFPQPEGVIEFLRSAVPESINLAAVHPRYLEELLTPYYTPVQAPLFYKLMLGPHHPLVQRPVPINPATIP